MTNIEKVKKIRELTFSPINKINEALARSNGDVGASIELLVKEKQVDANEIANRVANTKIVYSYVHNNRIGAMIVLACQTDFVAKNETFLTLAKNLCMHIVSTPIAPEFIRETDVNKEQIDSLKQLYLSQVPPNKPETVKQKIVEGKLSKFYNSVCLLNQPFVRDDTVTIAQLIKDVSATLGEKIEITKFVRLVAQ